MKTYKANLRIPTDTYAYVEVQTEGTPEEIIEEYQNLIKLSKHGDGLTDKEFNAFMDNYLVSNTGLLELYQLMNAEQQNIIQTIKRSLKRIKARADKQVYETTHH